jgi:membrane-associated phospholipid phosphatase
MAPSSLFVWRNMHRWLGLLALIGISVQAQAQPVVAGERLSDWMVRNLPSGADTTALQWRVPAERTQQETLRRAVIQGLPPEGALSPWLQALPLTGRLVLAKTDARWLQGTPEQDPVLDQGHSVVLFARPKWVAVLTDTGALCTVPHIAGALTNDYLLSCASAAGMGQVDFAWVAQPDGRTTKVGVAHWSQTTQDPPAPGAWIWAPARQAGISLRVSDNLIRFLATQPPAEFLGAELQTQKVTPIQALAPTGNTMRDAVITASDWGEVGLLQTPTARMAPAGEVRMHWSRAEPYTRGTLMFQPLDWLEAGFRYTDVTNRLYGPAIAGDQTYKDKSMDFKVRLLQESANVPQVAVGVRDVGGTGLFSAEYVVASKRWGNWDASVGMGWGYLGTRADFSSPLSLLGSGFATRQGNTNASGGTANFQDMFHGPAAVFGGVQWQSPTGPWILKAEWEGNSYQQEPLANNQIVTSPINVGAVYRYSPNVDFSAALERGNRLMVGFTFHNALNNLQAPKVLDPVLPRARAEAPVALPEKGWAGTVQALELYTGWSVQHIAQQQSTVTVFAETDGAVHLQERIDKAVSLLHRDAPATAKQFVLQLQERGVPLSQVAIDRTEWVAQHTLPQPPALRLPAQQVSPGNSVKGSKPTASRVSSTTAEWAPSYQQILGGPDDFLLYQIGVQAKVEHKFTNSTWLSADFNARLLDNYQKFVYDAPSDLPRVRTLQREFTTTSHTTMPLAQLTSMADVGGGHYASVYGGMLESMYGGLGAEWLYRPWHGPFAVGVDINHVQQRGFKQDLSFRDYSVNTGHATLYWDTGWNNVQVNLSAGQYLAGDVGATLDIKRVFSNGVALGAWATKTNVSAEQFGEGSFDKGVYINFPFDVLMPKSSPGIANFVWNPLTRDGGARLDRRFKLYDLTRQRDARAWKWRPDTEPTFKSAEDTTYVLAESPATLLDAPLSAGAQLVHQIAAIPASTWAWAGGIVLASSLLDNPLDQWVRDNQGGGLGRVGSVTNNMPYALAAGAGLLYLGVGGEPASGTAATSITAAAYTLGANWMTRYTVGRARPFDEQGSSNFNGFKSEAVRSGFASNHVAVAFALATPFAQQYNMPWLYAAAASTGIGRLNDREHWLSDTVAGGLMGYAIGSLLSDQQLGQRRSVRLSATLQSIAANWSF